MVITCNFKVSPRIIEEVWRFLHGLLPIPVNKYQFNKWDFFRMLSTFRRSVATHSTLESFETELSCPFVRYSPSPPPAHTTRVSFKITDLSLFGLSTIFLCCWYVISRRFEPEFHQSLAKSTWLSLRSFRNVKTDISNHFACSTVMVIIRHFPFYLIFPTCVPSL
jgi:hypothetical protein